MSQDDNDDTQGKTGILFELYAFIILTSTYNKDGSIKTGHISGWKSLPFKDRKAVIEKRKRLGIIFAEIENPADANRLKQLEEQNSKYMRKIKALTRKNGSNIENDDQSIDAGDLFGGRNAKKKAKKGNSS